MKRLALLAAAAASLFACSSSTSSNGPDAVSAFQGKDSQQVNLEFDTEIHADTAEDAQPLIDRQLYWLIGQFHALGGDPRLSWAKSTTTATSTATKADGTTKEGVVTFHVKIPVAWPKSVPVPKTYDIVLPKRMESSDQQAFYAKYKDTCLDSGVDDETDWSNAWYDFAPSNDGCKLDADDIVKPVAQIVGHEENSVGTYPEYDRIWSDKKFQAVVVFGRDDPKSTTDSDLGVGVYRNFVDGLKSDAAVPALANVVVKEEDFNDDDGSALKQATIDAELDGGRTVHVVAFLVAKASWLQDGFQKRFDPETAEADFVAYSGHAGLGGNTQRLEQFGIFKADQYQVHVYDGCDTYAYVDEALFKKKREVNGTDKDPFGTRDLDIVLNSLPTPWTSGDSSVLKLARALMNDGAPLPYDQILGFFPDSAHAVVVGDEDNKFSPPAQ